MLDALCAVAVAAGHPTAAAWVTDLGAFAGRSGMRELSVHAYLYRREMGEKDALDAARTLALEVENDHLLHLLDEERVPAMNDLLGKASSAT